MKKQLLLFLLMLFTTIAGFADSKTISFSGFGSSGNGVAATDRTEDIFTLTFAKNSGSNAPTYYASDIRIYAGSSNGGSITISCQDGYKMTGMVFTATGTSYNFSNTSASVGSMSISGTANTWSAGSQDVTSVTFQNKGTAQVRLSQVVITYEKVTTGGGDETDPTPVDLTKFAYSAPTATWDLSASNNAALPTLEILPADANLTITYTSSNPAVATVGRTDGIVTPVAKGETTITATFAGDANYNKAEASYTLTVTESNTGGETPEPGTQGLDITLDASNISGGSGSYGKYTFTEEGFTFTSVNAKQNSTIQFNTNNNSGKGSGIVVTATNPDYTIASIDVTFGTIGAGINVYSHTAVFNDLVTTQAPTIPIGATQVATALKENKNGIAINAPAFGIYPAGSGVVQISSVVVHCIANQKEPVDYTFDVNIPKTLSVGETYTINLGSPEPKNFTIIAVDDFASVTDEAPYIITALAPGTATFMAEWEADENYKADETEFSIEITAKKADVTKFEYSDSSATYDLASGATNSALPTLLMEPANLTVSYTSSNTAVATVDEKGEVTPVGKGETTITATFDGDANYNKAEASYTLIVSNSDIVTATAIFHSTATNNDDADYKASMNGAGNISGTSTTAKKFTAGNITTWIEKKNTGSTSQENSGEIRWYKGDILHITPNDDATITKVVIECISNSYATIADINDSYGKGSTTGTTFTWTGSKDSDLEIENTAQARFTKITVVYEGGTVVEPDPDVAPTSITFEPAAGNITTLQTISLSVDEEATTPVTLTYSIDSKDYDLTYTEPFKLEAGEHTVYVKASNVAGDFEAEAKYVVEAVTAYQIIFANNNLPNDGNAYNSTTIANAIEEGNEYVESIPDYSGIYPGKLGYGMKFGTGGSTGNVTLNLSDEGKVKATKVVVNAAAYNTSDKATLKITIGDTQSFSQALSTIDTQLHDYEFELDGSFVEKIKLETVGTSNARANVKGITVYFGEIVRDDYTALNNLETIEFVYNEGAELNLGESRPAKISFKSDNEAISVSDDGKISATKAGEATVTATWAEDNTWNEGTAEIKVKATKRTYTANFNSEYRLNVGESLDLTETVGQDAPSITLTAEGNYVSINGLNIEATSKGDATVNAVWGDEDYWNEGSAQFTVIVSLEAPKTPQFSTDNSRPVESDTEVTITVPGADKIYVKTYNIDGTYTTQEFDGNNTSITVNKMKRRFAAYGENDEAQSEEVEMFYNLGRPAEKVWRRCTEVSDLAAGDRIVLGYFENSQKDKYRLLMIDDGTNPGVKYFKGADYNAEIADDLITNKDNQLDLDETNFPENVMEITLEPAEDGKYKLAYGEKYLRSDNSADFYINDEATEFSIVKDEAGYLMITHPNSDSTKKDYAIEYNTSGNASRFATYVINHDGGSAQMPVTIFRLIEIEAEDIVYHMNLIYEKGSDASGIRKMAISDSANTDLEAGETNNEGATQYTAELTNVMGELKFGVEGIELNGHTKDIPEDVTFGHDPQNDQFDSEGNPTDYECDGQHDDYVVIKPGETYTLVNADDDNAVALSTNPHVYHGKTTLYRTATVSVELQPFYGVSMTLMADTDEKNTVSVDNINVNNNGGDDVYYNLQGIRVLNTVPGNVYIVRNGNDVRKIIAK